jgi:hypothetical protein
VQGTAGSTMILPRRPEHSEKLIELSVFHQESLSQRQFVVDVICLDGLQRGNKTNIRTTVKGDIQYDAEVRNVLLPCNTIQFY